MSFCLVGMNGLEPSTPTLNFLSTVFTNYSLSSNKSFCLFSKFRAVANFVCSVQSPAKVGCVCTFLPNKKDTLWCPFCLVGMNGLEPSTPTLSGWCSNQLSYIPIKNGGGNRIRTGDPLLARQVLYQLSYTPICS